MAQQPNIVRRPPPPPLPATVEELINDRKVAVERTLNDYVEEAYLHLYATNEDFKNYLYAVYDEQAVEGSLAMDNGEAVTILRDYAKAESIVIIAREKKATLVKALNVVLRRYGKSRKERKNMVGGSIVSDDE